MRRAEGDDARRVELDESAQAGLVEALLLLLLRLAGGGQAEVGEGEEIQEVACGGTGAEMRR